MRAGAKAAPDFNMRAEKTGRTRTRRTKMHQRLPLLDQSETQRLSDRLGPVHGIQLLGGAVQVMVDRVFREGEDLGDLDARLARSRPVEAVQFAFGQHVAAAGRVSHGARTNGY